jgi:tRNA(Arg) A34 adenosine deaminase TadA
MSLRIIHNLINNIHPDTNCKHGFQHFSGIYKNGKCCHLGHNHLRNSYNGECICFSTHAEMDVLYKVLKRCKLQPFKDIIDLSNYVIIVVRVSREGIIKNSRPCNQCLKTMEMYRIKKVVYSTDDGYKSEKPEHMERLHTSSGWNAYHCPERLIG